MTVVDRCHRATSWTYGGDCYGKRGMVLLQSRRMMFILLHESLLLLPLSYARARSTLSERMVASRGNSQTFSKKWTVGSIVKTFRLPSWQEVSFLKPTHLDKIWIKRQLARAQILHHSPISSAGFARRNSGKPYVQTYSHDIKAGIEAAYSSSPCRLNANGIVQFSPRLYGLWWERWACNGIVCECVQRPSTLCGWYMLSLVLGIKNSTRHYHLRKIQQLASVLCLKAELLIK